MFQHSNLANILVNKKILHEKKIIKGVAWRDAKIQLVCTTFVQFEHPMPANEMCNHAKDVLIRSKNSDVVWVTSA